MRRDVTIVTATIPPRVSLLQRAIGSAMAQTHLPAAFSIAVDVARQGDGPTRTRALAGVTTTWTAFLDDDDELLPHHLAHCLDIAEQYDVDVVVPWFKVVAGDDPIAANRHLLPDESGSYRNADGVFPSFAVTNLVRTEVARLATFGLGVHDDYRYWCALADAEAKFRITPEATWLYHHDSGNTSGEPDRWEASCASS